MGSVWGKLTPEAAMVAVEAVLGVSLTNVCVPRNSYINRVFEMELDSSERVVVKFYRPGRWSVDMICGEHMFLNRCLDLDLPVVVPMTVKGQSVFQFSDIPFAIFPKRGGRVLDEFDEALWQQTGRLLARLHNAGEVCELKDRISWRPAVATRQHLETILDEGVVPDDYRTVFEDVVCHFIDRMDPLFDSHSMSLIHGDCHFGNLIYRPDDHLFIVDFDDIVVGPPVQDLWMLLPDSVENAQKELSWFLEGYRTFRRFPVSSLDLIPVLALMRQVHFAAWCAVQADEPHFKYHFPQWGDVSYWNALVKDIGAGVNVVSSSPIM